jgi:hypothetical protein
LPGLDGFRNGLVRLDDLLNLGELTRTSDGTRSLV